MPERVDRETVKGRVIPKIMSVADLTEPPDEAARLFEDLGMGATVRRAMALPYSKIATGFGGKPVTQSDSGGLETVKESIDLVHRQANA